MNTTVKQEGELIVVTLDGRLDTAAAEQTAKELSVLNDDNTHDVVIDCKGLEYISSSGLRILLGIRKHTGRYNHTVTIKNINDDIRNVFKITGFLHLFTIE